MSCHCHPNNPRWRFSTTGRARFARAAIAHYRRQEGADALCFNDISQPGALPPDLTQTEAIARVHVRRDDGAVVSGATAFVSIWRQLPRWRWAANLASLPGMTSLLETAYRLFLPIRLALAWLVRKRQTGLP